MSNNPRASTSTDAARCNMTLLDGVFFKATSRNCSSNRIVAHCVKCLPKTVEVKGFNKCTSNFIGHLKRKHGNAAVDEYKKYLQQIKKKRTVVVTKSKSISNYIEQTKGDLDEDITKFFINSMVPLRAIEDSYFINICNKNANSSGKTMSRRSLSRKINDIYTNQMSMAKYELSKIANVCITTYIWSGRRRSFLAVAAHWISDELLRKSMALACVRFKGLHSYDSISKFLKDIYEDFDLSNEQIVATITDCGNVFPNALEEFGVKKELITTTEEFSDLEHFETDSDSESDLDVREPVRNLELPPHLRCNAHKLSLCASVDAKTVLENSQNSKVSEMHAIVMNKCNILWNKACSPKSSEIMRKVIGCTLNRPGATKWSSLYDGLKQIYGIKNKCALLCKSLALNIDMGDCEFKYIEEYLTCTEPVVEALGILNAQNYCFYGIVIPCLLALRRTLQKMQMQPFVYCSELATAYLQSVEFRFKSFFELSTPEAENAAISALSYPKFKNKWLSCVSQTYASEIQTIFKTVIAKEIANSPSQTRNGSKKSRKTGNEFFVFESDSDEEPPSTQASSQSRAETMISHYYDEPSEDIELLNRYPEIKTVFIKYNTPLPSSAIVEKMFSAININLPKSHMLCDQMFEKRIVLKANLTNEINECL